VRKHRRLKMIFPNNLNSPIDGVKEIEQGANAGIEFSRTVYPSTETLLAEHLMTEYHRKFNEFIDFKKQTWTLKRRE
jgi:hypothetical protein